MGQGEDKPSPLLYTMLRLRSACIVGATACPRPGGAKNEMYTLRTIPYIFCVAYAILMGSYAGQLCHTNET